MKTPQPTDGAWKFLNFRNLEPMANPIPFFMCNSHRIFPWAHTLAIWVWTDLGYIPKWQIVHREHDAIWWETTRNPLDCRDNPHFCTHTNRIIKQTGWLVKNGIPNSWWSSPIYQGWNPRTNHQPGWSKTHKIPQLEIILWSPWNHYSYNTKLAIMMLVDDYRGLKSPAIINVATKLLSMPGFISNSPPRDMVFATWRKVFIRDTRKVNARNTGAVNVLRATTNRQEQLETFLESAAWFPAKCLNGRLNNSRTLSFWQFRRTLPRCST